MERILVGIDASQPAWDALVRALCLAERIQAMVSVLMVFPSKEAEQTDGLWCVDAPGGWAVLRRVECEIESARSAGASIDLIVAEGSYEKELIGAARQLRATLLVAAAAGGDGQGGERESDLVGRLISGVDCRVELVSPKRHQERKKDGA